MKIIPAPAVVLVRRIARPGLNPNRIQPGAQHISRQAETLRHPGAGQVRRDAGAQVSGLNPVDEQPIGRLVNLHGFDQQIERLAGLFRGQEKFALPGQADLTRAAIKMHPMGVQNIPVAKADDGIRCEDSDEGCWGRHRRRPAIGPVPLTIRRQGFISGRHLLRAMPEGIAVDIPLAIELPQGQPFQPGVVRFGVVNGSLDIIGLLLRGDHLPVVFGIGGPGQPAHLGHPDWLTVIAIGGHNLPVKLRPAEVGPVFARRVVRRPAKTVGVGRQDIEIRLGPGGVQALQVIQVVDSPIPLPLCRGQAAQQNGQIGVNPLNRLIARLKQFDISGCIRRAIIPLQAQVRLVPNDDPAEAISVTLDDLADKAGVSIELPGGRAISVTRPGRWLVQPGDNLQVVKLGRAQGRIGRFPVDIARRWLDIGPTENQHRKTPPGRSRGPHVQGIPLGDVKAERDPGRGYRGWRGRRCRGERRRGGRCLACWPRRGGGGWRR